MGSSKSLFAKQIISCPLIFENAEYYLMNASDLSSSYMEFSSSNNCNEYVGLAAFTIT
jgi:hypothetical protein